MMMQSPQPMTMIPMMQSQPQPMMMMMQQPQQLQPQQPQQPQQQSISTTGANPDVTESGSMLDVAPEVKPSSSSTTDAASESSEGKRVIKLS
jgi:hypothetical protein